MSLLFASGACDLVRGRHGRTALQLAEANGNTDLVSNWEAMKSEGLAIRGERMRKEAESNMLLALHCGTQLVDGVREPEAPIRDDTLNEPPKQEIGNYFLQEFIAAVHESHKMWPQIMAIVTGFSELEEYK